MKEHHAGYEFPPREWRLIDDAAYPVHLGLAIDDVLMTSVERSENPCHGIVRFYQFSPPSVVVGCHQSIDELDLEFMASQGLQIGRRITGGGVIIMGVPGVHAQLGVSVVLRNPPGFPAKMGARYAILSAAIVAGLERLGLHATYLQNSDIALGGRKITGQAMIMTRETTFLHSTITIDYDIKTMLGVVGMEQSEENIARIASKFTTIKEHVPSITIERVKNALVSGFTSKYNAKLMNSALTQQELNDARELVKEKHGTREYLFQTDGTPMGSCFM